MKQSPELIESLKTAFERNGRAVELRPAMGQKTAITKVRAIVHAVPPRRSSAAASGRSDAQNAMPSGPQSSVSSDANSGFRARRVRAS